jgi:propionyl-CoA synthetase
MVDWFRKPREGVDGTLNACFNALDRHVIAGHATLPALVDEVGGRRRETDFAGLVEQVAAFGGVLKACGVAPGDTVGAWLPIGREAVIALLATVRVGAVHAWLPADLTAYDAARRLDVMRPTAVLSAGGLPFTEALDLAIHPVDAVVVKRFDGSEPAMREGRDIDWDVVLRAGRADPAPCAELPADAPMLALDDGSAIGTAAYLLGRADGQRPDADTVLGPLLAGRPVVLTR